MLWNETRVHCWWHVTSSPLLSPQPNSHILQSRSNRILIMLPHLVFGTKCCFQFCQKPTDHYWQAWLWLWFRLASDDVGESLAQLSTFRLCRWPALQRNSDSAEGNSEVSAINGYLAGPSCPVIERSLQWYAPTPACRWALFKPPIVACLNPVDSRMPGTHTAWTPQIIMVQARAVSSLSSFHSYSWALPCFLKFWKFLLLALSCLQLGFPSSCTKLMFTGATWIDIVHVHVRDGAGGVIESNEPFHHSPLPVRVRRCSYACSSFACPPVLWRYKVDNVCGDVCMTHDQTVTKSWLTRLRVGPRRRSCAQLVDARVLVSLRGAGPGTLPTSDFFGSWTELEQ